MEEQLIHKLREFCAREFERERSSWPSASFFLCRQDGVLVHAQRSSHHKMNPGDEHSAGVLISGVWQAASALIGLMPRPLGVDGMRLSFDTSDSGVYLLPIAIKGKSFYLGTLFAGEVNPAQMKAKVRNLVNKIEDTFRHLPEVASAAPGPSGHGRSDKKSEFLFIDISDEEVDKLFSAAGI